MAASKLSIECRCLPPNPFYVKWINRYGGLDYWMFSIIQEVEREQSNLETFERYIQAFGNESGTTELVSKTVTEIVTFGAEMLSLNEYQSIARMLESKVAWYQLPNSADVHWREMILDKSKLVHSTRNKLHSLEFTAKLPTIQLAI